MQLIDSKQALFNCSELFSVQVFAKVAVFEFQIN